MKERKTTEDTELAEFLYKLGQTEFNWYLTPHIRARRDNGRLVCPISAVYGGAHWRAVRMTDCPGLSQNVRDSIWRAADGYKSANLYIRQALLRAVGLHD